MSTTQSPLSPFSPQTLFPVIPKVPVIPVIKKTLSLNTSSNSTISNIWGSSPLTSFGFGRFVGLAKDGWKVYDSTSGLPAALKLADQKTFEGLGFGVGAKYDVTTRAGLNVDIREPLDLPH